MANLRDPEIAASRHNVHSAWRLVIFRRSLALFDAAMPMLGTTF